MLSAVGGLGLNCACGSSGGSSCISEAKERRKDDDNDDGDDSDSAAHFKATDCFSAVRKARRFDKDPQVRRPRRAKENIVFV